MICGADDNPHFTPRGPEWHADAYYDSRGKHALLTLTGLGHGLGGIAGLDARETEIDAPGGLEATKRLTLAWLKTALDVEPRAWASAYAALAGPARALARVEEKMAV